MNFPDAGLFSFSLDQKNMLIFFLFFHIIYMVYVDKVTFWTKKVWKKNKIVNEFCNENYVFSPKICHQKVTKLCFSKKFLYVPMKTLPQFSPRAFFKPEVGK
jgi:hypothetical protein